MRRRDLLAGLAGAFGALGLAGCNGAGGGDPAADDAGTLTPAPVPTTTRRPARASDGGCPGLPLEAELVRCSPATGRTLRLVPESSVYNAGSGPFTVTLRNGTRTTFRTGRDRWVLAQRTAGGWTVVARGEGVDRLWVGPGESFSWVLGGDGGEADGPERLAVAVGGGPHALAVVGAVPRGVRTALVARFRIEPSLG